MARRRYVELTFEKGLLESQEPSVVPPGFATEVLNWVPEPGGGLRARRGWLKGSTTSAPSTRRCVGIGYFTRLITPGIVQSSPVVSATGSPATIAPTWATQTTKGNLLVLVVAAVAAAPDITTPSGWTEAVKSGASGSRPRTAIYYKANASPESGSVTVTVSAVTAFAQLLEVAGITATSPLDRTQSNNAAASNAATTGTTAATTQAVEFIVASLIDEQSDGMTGNNSFQELSETDLAISTFGVFYKVVSATGAQSLTDQDTGAAVENAGAIATFKGWFTGTPAAGQVSHEEFLVAQNDTTEYDIWAIDRANLSAGTWVNKGSIAVADPSQLVAFAPGLGRTWIANPQFATLYSYDGVSVAAVTGAPTGRGVAVHKNRVWVAGANASPGRTHFSALNDGQAWTTATDFFDCGGKESGETIEDITPFEDGLLLGQRTALHFLSGDGPDTFTLDRLNGGGAAPGRSITPTPYGAVIAGRRHVWIWGGGGVLPISRPIEENYRAEDEWVSCSFIDESVYILADLDTGLIHVLHLPTGVWRTENTDEAASAIYNQDQTQLFGPASSTVASLVNHREFPGSSRGKDFDTMTQEFAASTEELWAADAESRFTPASLHVGVRQRGGTPSQTPVSVTPTYDGVAQPALAIPVASSAGRYRYRLDVGSRQGLSHARYRLSQLLGSGEAAVFDIERIVLELLEEERA